MKISSVHAKELQHAYFLLENPGFAIKIANTVGKPAEKLIEALPAKVSKNITKVTIGALGKATDAALFTLKEIPGKKPSNWGHKIAVTCSGAAGGFFGPFALAPELATSTVLMLRSVADIARSEGESLSDADAKLACLEVFAMGSGKSAEDDAADSAYYTVRAAMAGAVREAAVFLAEKKLTEKGAPVLIKLITSIAERFSITVTEKMAAQSLPIIGAVGGAGINLLFMDHFQDMAKGHFTVRRLERIYGTELIQNEYENLRRKKKNF